MANNNNVTTYNDLFQDCEMSNVEFVIGKSRTTIAGHKLIFAMSSDYWKKIFFGSAWQGSETQISRVVIPDLDEETFQSVKRHIYLREFIINDKICFSLLLASTTYHLYGLQSKCKKYIEKKLSVENCLSFLEKCIYYQSNHEILKKISQFLTENALQIFQIKNCFNTISQKLLILILESPLCKFYDLLNSRLIEKGISICKEKQLLASEKNIGYFIKQLQQILINSNSLQNKMLSSETTKQQTGSSLQSNNQNSFFTENENGSTNSQLFLNNPDFRLINNNQNGQLKENMKGKGEEEEKEKEKEEEKEKENENKNVQNLINQQFARLSNDLNLLNVPVRIRSFNRSKLKNSRHELAKNEKYEVLLMTTDSNKVHHQDVMNSISGVDNCKISFIDVSEIIPSFYELRRYDSIFLYSSIDPFFDPIKIGNILAEYVKDGGGLVMCSYRALIKNALKYKKAELQGNLFEQNFIPISKGELRKEARGFLGNILEANHPIVEGVKEFNGGSLSYRINCQINYEGEPCYLKEIAKWDDQKPLIVAKQLKPNYGKVVALNLWPVSGEIGSTKSRYAFWLPSTHGKLIIANSLNYVMNKK
ncbi:btb (poz) domain-containing 2a-related [Anaeramoeba flamelloides]|uniref:Btb (Poz) domain-containing 2a-related n=1 Tax=Anaeramoeba flamelloides TaxID=1746091 RepID=A0ABQ8XS26_9EUKA|nr:btb (poz) domain-containing 2a-related [Anaeramoeba flamelloides]